MLDVVDGGRQGPLVGSDDAAGHLIGRHTLVLPGNADDRDVDTREDIDGHAHRRQYADDQQEQGADNEGVGPGERNSDEG